jgi:hypothetical protein
LKNASSSSAVESNNFIRKLFINFKFEFAYSLAKGFDLKLDDFIEMD